MKPNIHFWFLALCVWATTGWSADEKPQSELIKLGRYTLICVLLNEDRRFDQSILISMKIERSRDGLTLQAKSIRESIEFAPSRLTTIGEDKQVAFALVGKTTGPKPRVVSFAFAGAVQKGTQGKQLKGQFTSVGFAMPTMGGEWDMIRNE